MKQYKTQYGTVFAVREYKGAPAIMCRAEISETWSLSSMIAPFTPGAWTEDELQAQLENWAAVKGWKQVEDTASDCLCSTCTCTGCHENCFHNCTACGNPVTECNSYQTEGEKRLPASAEPPEIVDECSEPDCMCRNCGRESCFAHGCAKECPANAEESCLTVICPEYIEKAIENPTAAAVDVPPCAPTASDAQTSPFQSADAGAKTGAEESGENPTPAAPVSRADAGAAEQGLSAAGPASLEAKDMNVPTFDYSGLNVVTVDTLHLAENIIRSARQKYIVDLAGAVDMAHEELVRNSDGHNQHTEETFVAWCRSVGISKTTAYQLLQVQALLTGSTTEEQATLEAASPSLLYAAAKPSAPAELVQAVKDGDITTHKQYQEALAEIRARDAKIKDLLEMSEAADRRAEEAERKRQEANEGYSAAMETLRQAQEDAADADARARAAEHDRDEARKERDGARDALQAVKLRGDRLKAENDDLKARPIEAAVVDEDEIARRVEERVRCQMADREADRQQQAVRNAEDAILLLGRQINTAWQMVRPFLAEMEESRRVEAIDRINREWAQTQEEIMQCL